MTRIAGIADLHIGARHLCTLDDERRAIAHVIEIVEERHVDVVIVAGDSTHYARPTPEVLALLGSFVRELERLDVDIVVVAGNHDEQVPTVAEHFRGRIHVAYAPEPGAGLPVFRLDGIDVACLPYLPDRYVRAAAAGTLSKEEVAARLSFAARSIISGFRLQRRPGVPMVLAGHFTVAGSTTPTGFNLGWMPGTTWVVPVEDIADFDLVVAGHVHRHQAWGDVVVPGSLMPLDFSETEPKGVVIADITDHSRSWEFVPVTTPKVGTWHVGWEERSDVSAREELQQLVTEDLGPVPDLLRVQVRCDETLAREYPPARIERALVEAGARKVQVELDVARENRARDAEMTTDLLPLTALGRYTDARSDLEAPARIAIAAAAADVAGEVMADRDVAGVGELDVVRLEATDLIGLAEVAVDLEHVQLAVLQGPVGSGKSNVGADLLRFALFGATRYGAKASERVIREGADVATAAVELRDASGHEYRVVRKVKRDGRGRTTQTLDVLEGGRPLSDGKIESGSAAIAKLLGRLSDRTLCAANIVLQRDADRFAAAPAEQRKDLLSEAAGLEMYGDLSLRTAKRLNEAEKDLARLEAQAEPLRVRAAASERLEAERADAELERGMAAADVTRLEREHTEATDTLERARERADAYAKAFEEAAAVQGRIEQVEAQVAERTTRTEAALAEWEKKASVARAMVADKAALLEARSRLEAKRVELAAARTALEEAQAGLDAAQAAAAAHAKAEALELRMQREIDQLKARRDREVAAAGAEIRTRERHAEELRASGCLERCTHDKACTVRREATDNDDAISTIADRVRDLQAPSADEVRLAKERDAIEFPEETPDTRGCGLDVAVARGAVDRIEKEIVALERQTQVAEKIAAAEQVLKEHDEAVARLRSEHAEAASKLRTELAPLRTKRGELNVLLLSFGANPRGERDRAAAEQDRIAREVGAARTTAQRAGERAALLDGRLEELRAAAAELVQIEGRIHTAAAQVAIWKELIVAWRACRVMTLENSVIPAVEDLANDVLHRFPYGLQLRLVTQREKKSGDGLAETLDIEVIGGKAPVYEGCSGGQRTAIDAATHIAIALVVARRQTTRLRWLYLDEPEGLDADGRAAFAAIARSASEELGMKTVVASHHEDLVEQLGGMVIRIEGIPGAARVGAAAQEPERVSV